MSDNSRNGSAISVRRVSFDDLEIIKELNRTVFGENRVINRYDRRDLCMMLAWVDAQPVGFKVGYAEKQDVYYSAKGGVLAAYRRRGIATAMLEEMIEAARRGGYARFAFESFPNRFPEMTALAIKMGFTVVAARYDPRFKDVKVRFERALGAKTARK